jgi:hypothetical protein
MFVCAPDQHELDRALPTSTNPIGLLLAWNAYRLLLIRLSAL